MKGRPQTGSIGPTVETSGGIVCTSTCLIWDPAAKSTASSYLREVFFYYRAGKYQMAADFIETIRGIALSPVDGELLTAVDIAIQAALAGRLNERGRWRGISDCIPGHMITFESHQAVELTLTRGGSRPGRRLGTVISIVPPETPQPARLSIVS